MKVAFRDSKGKYGGTWDGPNLKFDRDAIGPGETFELIQLDAPIPPIDPPSTLPPYATWQGTDQEWFMRAVEGKPFGQQTLLDLEPTLNENGWLLTPPNAAGDRTKVLPPDGPWVRVGFGEGYWVWIEQA